MSTSEKVAIGVAVGVGVIGLLAGGLGLLIGVLHAGASIISSGLLLVLQLVVGGLTVILAAVAAWLAVAWTRGYVAERLGQLEDRYAEEFERLRAKRPAWIAAFVLLTEGAMLFAEHAFEGHKKEAFLVSVTLLVGFWIANQMMTCEEAWKRICGIVVWFAVLALTPTLLIVDVGWPRFVADLRLLSVWDKLAFAAATLLLIAAPALTGKLGAKAAAD